MCSTWKNFAPEDFQAAQNKIRTAPLWGIRFRNRLMHDGASGTLRAAILRHGDEAGDVTRRFQRLSRNDQEAILVFLGSL